MNANGCARAVRLVSLNTIDMNDPLLAVNLGDLALTSLVFAPYNPNLVVLANRQ